MRHEIRWQGTFDSAHFIPGHPKCGRLHGHTYRVQLRILGDLPESGPAYLLDYGLIKERVTKLDHKLLIPSAGRGLGYSISDDKVHAQWKDFDQVNGIQLSRCMVEILPLKETSSELLAQYLAELFTDIPQVLEVEAVIGETPNTEARWTWKR